ncbi:MAG: PhnD/SsuA/transferrin family substrate-binding protein [Gemmataceae bacterium]
MTMHPREADDRDVQSTRVPRRRTGGGPARLTFAAAKAVRIGVVATLSPGTPTVILAMAMRPLRSYLEEQTGSAGEVVQRGDAFDLARSLTTGRAVQVAIFHGHEFAWARAKQPTLEPVVVCVNPLRSVRAHLVAGPGFAGSLQGQAIALPRDAREHCRLYFQRRCVPPGTDPNVFYRRIARPAESADALDDAATGRVQAAVVDAVALDRYQRAMPARARKLRALHQSEEFPPGVLAYDTARLAADEAKRIRDALVGAKDHPRGRQSLQVLKLASFEAPGADLAPALDAIAKAYPPQ